ncbi:MAG: PepSY domain-containing protein [Fimbriimonadaceae bacterium]|nr:PepSY domain-containing protein [Fimbriimonadaceae bacterium]
MMTLASLLLTGCWMTPEGTRGIAETFLRRIGSPVERPEKWTVAADAGEVLVTTNNGVVGINPLDGQVFWYSANKRAETPEAPRTGVKWKTAAEARAALESLARTFGASQGWVPTYEVFRLDSVESGKVRRGLAVLKLEQKVNGLDTVNGGNLIRLDADPHTGALLALKRNYLTSHEGATPSLTATTAREKARAALQSELRQAKLGSVPAIASSRLCYSVEQSALNRPANEGSTATLPMTARLAYEVVFAGTPEPRHPDKTRHVKLYVDAQNGNILYRAYDALK